MTWITLIPANTGGGRQRKLKTARLAPDGQFSMSHAVADMLGNPQRVRVEIDPAQGLIRMTPTTPDSRTGFALSGGGNSSHRLRMMEAITLYKQPVGEYEPRKQANCVVFMLKGEEVSGELEV